VRLFGESFIILVWCLLDILALQIDFQADDKKRDK
jgi:hypothetical protein